MLAYAVLAWVYRMFIYSGIAWILYYRLTRMIGCLVFAWTIYCFILKPTVCGVVALLRSRNLRWNPRAIAMMGTACLVLAWLILPLPRFEAMPAITSARESQTIYTPGEGVIRAISIGRGMNVCKGQTLLVVDSEELERRRELAHLKLEEITLELAMARINEERRSLLPQKSDELA